MTRWLQAARAVLTEDRTDLTDLTDSTDRTPPTGRAEGVSSVSSVSATSRAGVGRAGAPDNNPSKFNGLDDHTVPGRGSVSKVSSVSLAEARGRFDAFPKAVLSKAETDITDRTPLARPPSAGFRAAPEDIDAFEERAAIREFDGGQPRAEAEAAAWAEMHDPFERAVAAMWSDFEAMNAPHDPRAWA